MGGYCLYVLVVTGTSKYRIYGPHVYQYHEKPNQSTHNIGNWVPTQIPPTAIYSMDIELVAYVGG